MIALYPNYRPSGVRKAWDHSSMETFGSGVVLRNYGVPGDWGDPTEAVAWADDKSGRLRMLVADYANGRRVTLRKRVRDHQITFENQS